METFVCTSCRLPKADLECENCHAIQCKKCIQVLKKNSFAFLKEVPEELGFKNYCGSCYDEKVLPHLKTYEETMDKAKEVLVFFKGNGEETRLIRRVEKPIRVTDCDDRDETILRLAFYAAQAGYNGLVDVTVTAEKVRNKGYQTTHWQGIGVPVQIDPKKYETKPKKTWI